MIYHQQITLCIFLAIVSSVRLMPIHVEETTDGGLATTTEEPFIAATDHEDPAVWSPSQNVEVRLHPQLLRTGEPKGPVDVRVETQEPTTTTSAPAVVSEEDAHVMGSNIFGRKVQVEPQTQHGSFIVQTGRTRSKESLGAALRRAVTGSPSVQKLQQTSTSRMGGILRNTPVSSARAKAGGISGRKIVGFGTLTNSNLPAPRLPSISAARKETLFKNRPVDGQGGETPAGTRIESLSPHWLYSTGKDTRKSVDSFRLSSNERLLVLGLREKTLVNATEETAVAATTAKSVTSTEITTTTTSQVDIDESSTTVSDESNDATTAAEMTERVETTTSTTESNPFIASSSKTKSSMVSADLVGGESIKEFSKSPLDGHQELVAAIDEEETGLNMGELLDQDAHKYLVEEKTHDGYIIGEFGVISPSSDILRGVRYTAHGSTDPQLIQEMLRIFWSL